MYRPSTTLLSPVVVFKSLLILCVSIVVASFTATNLQATPISYSAPLSTYSENFDSLADSDQGDDITWTDGTTVPGWYANSNGSVPVTYKVNNGTTANTLGIHSNGSVGGGGTNPDSDRALGTQSNSSSTMRLGLALANDTGSTLIGFTATYDGEQWRRINSEGADDYQVEYQIFNAGLGSLTAGGIWTSLSGLTFNAPSVSIGGGTVSLDGNNPSFRVAGLTQSVSDLNWGAGQELWIRFTDTGAAQHQLAIDNFSFSAEAPVPEPSSFLLLGLGMLGLMHRSQRRSARS